MAKRTIKAGVADQTVDIFVMNSSSTTGAGLTGLVFNSASLVCYYRKNATGSATALTLATQTVGGVHSDGGFVEIDATNMPGMYRLDLSDIMVATGPYVTVMLKGATNMAPVVIELELVAYDITDGVRLGLTGLANAVPGATGGLFIAGTNAATTITTSLTTAFTGSLTGSVASVTGAVGSVTGAVGSVTGSVGSVTGAVGSVTGAVGSVSAGGIAAASFAAGAIDATAIAADAIGASELAADAIAEIADGILNRDMSTGTDSGSPTVRTMRQALRFLRNKWSIATGTLTVTKEDDTTASWTSAVTGTAGADPITASDPA